MPQEPQWLIDARADGRILNETGVKLPVMEADPPAKKKKVKKGPLVTPSFTTDTGVIRIVYPLRLEPVANGAAFKKSAFGRAGKDRKPTGLALSGHLLELHTFQGRMLRTPITCTLTRIGGRGNMDDDNLRSAFKWVRDTLCMFLGVDDGKKCPIIWVYDQEPGPEWGVKITLEV